MSLVNTTDVGSSATVPDAATTTKWKDYIWVRRLGAAGEAKFYIWNENATSDATYLKWQEKSDVVVSDIPMTSGQMLVGGTGNVGTAVTLEGDATVDNLGNVTVNGVAADKITNAMVKSDAAIASTKLAAIPWDKVTTTGEVTNADLAGSIANDKLVAIANDKLAGGISQGKLEGLIPVSKLFLNDGDIPFGRIDKIFEKNIDVQGVISTANGNFPEYSTPTGMAIPQVDDNGIIATIADTTPTPSAAWQASQTPPTMDGHESVAQTSTNGSGSGARFSIATDAQGNPTFTLVSGGVGYVSGNTLTFTDPGNTTNTAVVTVSGEMARKKLEGIYRAIVTSGSTPTTLTLPDPSSGTYDGKIFKLSIYRANATTNKGPVYLRTAGKAVNSGQCTANDVQLTLGAGHGFVTGDKVSVLGVFDDNGRDYGASDVAVTVTTNVIEYELPKVDVDSIIHGTIATITDDTPTATGNWYGSGMVVQETAFTKACTTTNSSTTVNCDEGLGNSGDTRTDARTSMKGKLVVGTGIPANTTVESVNHDAATFVISNAATASGAVTLAFKSTDGAGTGAIFTAAQHGSSPPTFTLAYGGTGFVAGDKIYGLTEPNAQTAESVMVEVATVAATSTVTTAYPHPFKTGDKLNISGATGGNAAAYNQSFSSITRTGNKTFTISVATPQTAAAGTLKVCRTGGTTGGLANFTSQRGVVVKANKLVDNAAGVLADVLEVIPETNDPWPKKVVLDVTCDSDSGDGQWLISGHGGDRQKFSKTGNRLELSAGELSAGSNGTLTFLILTNKPKAGDVLTFEGGSFEVTENTASNSNDVTGRNTGEKKLGGDNGVKFVTQPPPLSNDAEFITSLGGSSVFFDPKTGQIIMPTIDWKPRSSSPYVSTTP